MKMDTPYTFYPHLIMRAPRKYFEASIQEHFQLANFIADNAFMEAIFLASPILHEELLKYADGKIIDSKEIQKLQLSLAKYYLRMSNRCTPFGLFSGCTTAAWAIEETNITIDKSTRHTRFDMHYLCALAQHFASLESIKNKLLYFPNSSYYILGDEIRYIEYSQWLVEE
jgi:lantibiotic biosynthesis protein